MSNATKFEWIQEASAKLSGLTLSQQVEWELATEMAARMADRADETTDIAKQLAFMRLANQYAAQAEKIAKQARR